MDAELILLVSLLIGPGLRMITLIVYGAIWPVLYNTIAGIDDVGHQAGLGRRDHPRHRGRLHHRPDQRPGPRRVHRRREHGLGQHHPHPGSLYPWLTVRDNVALPLRRSQRKRALRRQTAEESLAAVGLTLTPGPGRVRAELTVNLPAP